MSSIETFPPPQSPFNLLPPRKIRDLPRTFLLEQLEDYYQTKPPVGAVESDYSLWECAETGLQFAWPMLPGNSIFYEWVSRFPTYYPGNRWEYRQVRDLLEGDSVMGKEAAVLDVGCGKGDFLRGLNSVSIQKYGLDFNEPAIEACRQNGFRAFCGTVESALQADFFKPSMFSAVTSFHCLEHVDNPIQFVRSLLKVTASGGRVFISTPYSPMSFEVEHFDVMNHPPHHLTRWNLKPYQRLAELLGVKMRCHVPFSTAAQRTLAAFRVMHYGPWRSVSRKTLLADLLHQIPTVWRLYHQQLERKRKYHGIGADVILVELEVP